MTWLFGLVSDSSQKTTPPLPPSQGTLWRPDSVVGGKRSSKRDGDWAGSPTQRITHAVVDSLLPFSSGHGKPGEMNGRDMRERKGEDGAEGDGEEAESDAELVDEEELEEGELREGGRASDEREVTKDERCGEGGHDMESTDTELWGDTSSRSGTPLKSDDVQVAEDEDLARMLQEELDRTGDISNRWLLQPSPTYAYQGAGPSPSAPTPPTDSKICSGPESRSELPVAEQEKVRVGAHGEVVRPAPTQRQRRRGQGSKSNDRKPGPVFNHDELDTPVNRRAAQCAQEIQDRNQDRNNKRRIKNGGKRSGVSSTERQRMPKKAVEPKAAKSIRGKPKPVKPVSIKAAPVKSRKSPKPPSPSAKPRTETRWGKYTATEAQALLEAPDTIVIFTDASTLQGSWSGGAVVWQERDGVCMGIAIVLDRMDNSLAEGTILLEGVRIASQLCTEFGAKRVFFLTDSEFALLGLLNAMKGGLVHRTLIKMAEKVRDLQSEVEELGFGWTKGHRSCTGNVIADLLARYAADKALEGEEAGKWLKYEDTYGLQKLASDTDALREAETRASTSLQLRAPSRPRALSAAPVAHYSVQGRSSPPVYSSLDARDFGMCKAGDGSTPLRSQWIRFEGQRTMLTDDVGAASITRTSSKYARMGDAGPGRQDTAAATTPRSADQGRKDHDGRYAKRLCIG